MGNKSGAMTDIHPTGSERTLPHGKSLKGKNHPQVTNAQAEILVLGNLYRRASSQPNKLFAQFMIQFSFVSGGTAHFRNDKNLLSDERSYPEG